ncbi:tRNA pseudouridine synthase A [Helicovermis profundi]|uniref:tRNA pseudouridine synthase A n=1 Tax=Helicovermis profundi TaxID=3065157 RepID=A0AAU9ECJ7_9FIRM|nr:tRNA pseudouridine(38-40) synthase TruA [Clostridia bacterium S502]
MQNYKMTIAYDGHKYMGFSKKKNNPSKSIEGKLETILLKLYNQEIEVIGAINTAAGVHAREQIVNFKAPNGSFKKNEIHEYFEKYLPDDIIVINVEKVEERFQSKYLVKSATYEYRLWKNNAQNRPLFERNYVNLMVQNLNVGLMKKAEKYIEGEHDFLAFTTNRKVKNPVKKIFLLDVKETNNEIIITIKANSYLLNMERLIVGTLIQVGLKQLPLNSIENAFISGELSDVGHKAMAGALCLVKVEY